MIFSSTVLPTSVAQLRRTYDHGGATSTKVAAALMNLGAVLPPPMVSAQPEIPEFTTAYAVDCALSAAGTLSICSLHRAVSAIQQQIILRCASESESISVNVGIEF